MKHQSLQHETWLDLSQAADYLGVHFTTLRRWADSGQLAYIRTPGGRRRFTRAALDAFVQQMGQGSVNEASNGQLGTPEQPPISTPAALPALEPASLQEQAPLAGVKVPLIEAKAIQNARKSVLSLSGAGNWLERMSTEQRQRLKGTGHQLMALLLQYNARSEGGDVYLEEGRRITSEYSQVCASVGLSLIETVHIFLFFRRSILDALHETGFLAGSRASAPDYEGQQLYLRTTDYLDLLLLELISSYQQTQA